MKSNKTAPTGFEEKNKQDKLESAPPQANIKNQHSKAFEAALRAVEDMGNKVKH